MTENDYIAEYVKQNYPNILGFEFIMWKTGKQVCNICNELLGALRDIFENDITMDELKTIKNEGGDADESCD